MAIALLILVIVSSARVLDAASGPLVGQLSGNVLALQLNNQVELLVIDLDAGISSTRTCSRRSSSTVLDVTLNSTNGANPTGPSTIRGISFRCGAATAGLLATSSQSLPAQLASERRIANKFSYCLTSGSPSPIFFGVNSVTLMPGKVVSSLLKYTPLVPKPPKASQGYYIGVKGLRFNNSHIALPANTFEGGVKISSTETYTRLARPAYMAVTEAFGRMTLPRVKAVQPFSTCFKASALGSTRVGPAVPQVELQLDGDNTLMWFGANTIAFPGDGSVACVAFLDAGPPPATSVVGIFQQRNSLVEFDVPRKRVGFTGLLYGIQTTCANFNFTAA